MNCESGTCVPASGSRSHVAGQCDSGSQTPCGQTPCGPGACGCPVEQAIDKWNDAFCQAIGSVQVDLLKDRIRKTWGPVLEKEADAIVAAMGVAWQSKLTFAKAQVDLRDNIREILESAAKS